MRHRIDSAAAGRQRIPMKVLPPGGRDIALSTVLLVTTAFAWLGVIGSASEMHMSPMEPLSGPALTTFTVEWGVMMTAMMLPSAAPMIMLYGMSGLRTFPCLCSRRPVRHGRDSVRYWCVSAQSGEARVPAPVQGTGRFPRHYRTAMQLHYGSPRRTRATASAAAGRSCFSSWSPGP